MAYKQVLLGDYFKFEKGLGYKGEFLAEESDVGLIGIDSQIPGGGYKQDSEKPYSGPFKPEHVVNSGDVIVATTDITQDGSVLGSTLMVPEISSYETLIYSGDVMKAIPLQPEVFNLEYFYNLYRVEKYRKILAYGDSGTTVRRIASENLAEQLVPLPDLSTQIAINEIISLIDQQISNNKSLSKNLELLAQSIFKSWFIDFDSVHAKSRGEKPFGMDDETAALFPDSFEESELGMIPKGWTISSVEEIFLRHPFKPEFKSPEEYAKGNIPIVQQGEPMIIKYGDSNKLLECNVTNPLIVFGDHTCRMILMATPFIALPNTIILRDLQGATYWAFHATNGIQKFETYRRHWMEFAAKKIVVPNIDLRKSFGINLTEIYSMKNSLLTQNRALEKVRDLLLPRLISGELQIPEEMLVS